MNAIAAMSQNPFDTLAALTPAPAVPADAVFLPLIDIAFDAPDAAPGQIGDALVRSMLSSGADRARSKPPARDESQAYMYVAAAPQFVVPLGGGAIAISMTSPAANPNQLVAAEGGSAAPMSKPAGEVAFGMRLIPKGSRGPADAARAAENSVSSVVLDSPPTPEVAQAPAQSAGVYAPSLFLDPGGASEDGTAARVLTPDAFVAPQAEQQKSEGLPEAGLDARQETGRETQAARDAAASNTPSQRGFNSVQSDIQGSPERKGGGAAPWPLRARPVSEERPREQAAVAGAADAPAEWQPTAGMHPVGAAPERGIRGQETRSVEAQPASPVLSRTVREIAVKIAHPDAPPVELRVLERGGEIRVSVRTPDAALQTSMRQDLGTLAHALDRAGYRAETFVPREASAPAARAGEARFRQERGNPDRGASQDPGEQRGQRQRRGKNWMKELEKSA